MFEKRKDQILAWTNHLTMLFVTYQVIVSLALGFEFIGGGYGYPSPFREVSEIQIYDLNQRAHRHRACKHSYTRLHLANR